MSSQTHRRLASRRSRAAGLTVTVALVAAWLVFLRPTGLGGPAGYVIVAGTSMEPTFHTGDLAMTQRQAVYALGDVIAFSVDGGVVIHRIVGGDADEGYVTRGDNRELPDPWRPRPDAILGSVWVSLPGVGNLLALGRQPPVLAGLAAGVAFFLVLTTGPTRSRKPRAPSVSAAAAPVSHARDAGP